MHIPTEMNNTEYPYFIHKICTLQLYTGKPADFFYPEFSLQTEVQSVNASLQYQLRELEEQVVGLENENTRIRSAMKNQVCIYLAVFVFFLRTVPGTHRTTIYPVRLFLSIYPSCFHPILICNVHK